MNWRFGNWSKAEPSADAPPEQRRIHPPTRDAFWGSKFRSCTFKDPSTPQVGQYYFKAVREAAGNWSVFRVTLRDAPDDKDPREAVKKEKTGLSFFSALDFIAHFEEAEKPLDRLLIDAGEKEKLGYGHYRAFGEREGVVFDASGRPHETLDGEIVTDGEFREADKQQMLQHFEPARQSIKKIFNGQGQKEIEALMSTVMSKGALQGSFDILKQAAPLNAVKGMLYDMGEYWKKSLDYHYSNEFNSKGYPYETENSYGNEIESRFKKIPSLLKQCEAKDDVAEFLKVFDLCQFHYCLQRAQMSYYKLKQGEGDQKAVDIRKAKLLDAASQAGIAGASESHIDAMIVSLSGQPPVKLPDVFFQFKRAVDSYQEDVRVQADQVTQAHTHRLTIS